MPMPVPAPAPPRSALSKQLVLESLDLFKTVKSPTLEWLTNQLQRRRLEKSECLFSVGDTADALYIVAEGCVRVWTVSSAGVEITLNVLTPGAILGEIGMLDGSVRTAGASAMLPSDLWIIQRRVFFDALDRDPALARNVITLLCHRLRWVSARMEDAALLQAPQRLARIVCHLARDHGTPASGSVEIAIKLTQGELAQWTNMSRENLNKTLGRWVDEGLVTHARGRLVVLNLDRIEEIAESGEA